MPIAKGLYKQLRYKAQTGQGVAAGSTGGQILRRVTSDLSLVKDSYQSERSAPTSRSPTSATACAASKAPSRASCRPAPMPT